VDVDQLEFSVSTPLGVALGAMPRPTQPGATLQSPQSVSIYLPDALADQVATCTVRAFAGGLVTATGSGSAMLALNKLVPLSVDLVAGAGDGAAPEDGAMDGSEGDASTDGDAATDVALEAGPATDAPKAIGAPCGSNSECDSTACVDGVCCASACNGICEACNVTGKAGTCSPVPAGTSDAMCAKQPSSTCGFDGTCDGNGGCRRYPVGVACKAEGCQGALYVPAAACDGQGTCMAPANVDCSPYICDSTGGSPACRTTCRAGGTDCQAPATCVNSSCGAKVKKAAGAGCVDGTDCLSTFCVDGVCCVSTCTTSCNSCNQTGKEGMCLPVPAGKVDPRNVCKDAGIATCGKNGLCDGMGGCQVYPTTAVCAAASCNTRFVKPERHCDGKGACVAAADVDCQPYRCDPTTTACFKSCTDNNQCSAAPKRVCNPQMMVCQ
jgi:hypothetical protein